MKKFGYSMLLTLCFATVLLCGCGAKETAQSSNAVFVQGKEVTKDETGSENAADTEMEKENVSHSETDSMVASKEEMTAPIEVLEEGMEPIFGTSLRDGVYDVAVDSSSSMFHVVNCKLYVEDGVMTAVMTMGGTGYLHLYMGTGEQAVTADKEEYIPFAELDSGEHTFTIPVKALDAAIDCAAFSKKKEKWYDRILVFRADSLPTEAFAEGVITTCEALDLEDGNYTIEVSLEGGSGKAFVESPAQLAVEDGKAYALIIWSSSNYDYMKVEDVKYETVNEELGIQGNSVFRIPVTGFDYKMPVIADTIAMSTPHEIEYTLFFDSTTIQ